MRKSVVRNNKSLQNSRQSLNSLLNKAPLSGENSNENNNKSPSNQQKLSQGESPPQHRFVHGGSVMMRKKKLGLEMAKNSSKSFHGRTRPKPLPVSLKFKCNYFFTSLPIKHLYLTK